MTKKKDAEESSEAPAVTTPETTPEAAETVAEPTAEVTPASGVLLDALKDKIKALIPQLTEAHEQDKTRITSAPCPSCKRDVEAQNRLGSRVPELVQELAELAK